MSVFNTMGIRVRICRINKGAVFQQVIFCRDHQDTCCTFCVTVRHKSCSEIFSLEEASRKVQKKAKKTKKTNKQKKQNKNKQKTNKNKQKQNKTSKKIRQTTQFTKENFAKADQVGILKKNP